MAIGCKIIRDFKRPAPELIARFEGMPVANIDDNMGRIAAVDAGIEPIGYKGQLLGPAFTIKVPQGDNLMFHAAMDLAKPGDVIVIDAGGFVDRAIFGELMATYCKARGIKGIVCDGPYKNGPGEINVPVVIGGKIVNPGDIVVGDDDGVLFIDPAIAAELADATEATQDKENSIMEHIVNDKTYIRPWVDEKLKEIGCEII